MGSATRLSIHDLRAANRTTCTTLLELVRAVGEITDDEDEIVARALALLLSGRVRLTGSFRNEPVESFAD